MSHFTGRSWSLRRCRAGLVHVACILAPAIAFAQAPWTVTLTPTMNPLPIGFCAAVQLTILDASGKDAPRNSNGLRVTMADFDMAAAGASVAGFQIDSTHFAVCACQGGSAGSTGTVTATYPAKAIAAQAKVPAFQRTATFVLAPPKGALDPAPCVNKGPVAISASPTSLAAPVLQPSPTAVAPAPAPTPATPATAVALPPVAPPVTLAPAPVPAPATPPTAVALPPVAPPVTLAPAPVPAPATPPTAVALPPVAPPVATAAYTPGPVTVNFDLNANGSWYEPGPVVVSFALSAQGLWYEPGPVTVTFDLSATGNWIEPTAKPVPPQPAPPIQPAPPGL